MSNWFKSISPLSFLPSVPESIGGCDKSDSKLHLQALCILGLEDFCSGGHEQ